MAGGATMTSQAVPMRGQPKMAFIQGNVRKINVQKIGRFNPVMKSYDDSSAPCSNNSDNFFDELK